MNTLLLQAPAAAPVAGASGILGNPLVFMILMIAIFYFVAIRPQQRREKERKAQIEAIRAGTRVFCTSGIVGVVEEVRADVFIIRSADARLEIARGAIERILTDEKPAAQK